MYTVFQWIESSDMTNACVDIYGLFLFTLTLKYDMLTKN